MRELTWISDLAFEGRKYSTVLGSYFAKVVNNISFEEISNPKLRRSWILIIRDVVHYQFDPDFEIQLEIDKTLDALETIGINIFNQKKLDEKKLTRHFTAFFNFTFDILNKHPFIFDFIDHVDLIQDMAGTVAKRYIPIFKLFPLFCDESEELMPKLKEPLFTAIYELDIEDSKKIATISKKILKNIYLKNTRPLLYQLFHNSPKGKYVLIPLIDSAFDQLTNECSTNTLIHILCTPRNQLTQGRIITLILQELGGMYVKLSQIIAELAPPGLSSDLQRNQDQLGGIFPSQKKSWNYILNLLDRPSIQYLVPYLKIPDSTQESFAGASIGAIYEFELSELGKIELQSNKTILLKVQRPGLSDLFHKQKESLLILLDKTLTSIRSSQLSPDEVAEVSTMILVIKRNIINYALQSASELDFRIEKENSEKIKEALKNSFQLQVPHYFHVETDIAIMEFIDGDKITSAVHSKYLERMEIANLVSDAYLNLMFKEGIIWADPHAGNILYDPNHRQVKLIDLNPCFHWDKKTIHTFINFIYRLILSDYSGIINCLVELVDDPQYLENAKTKALIKEFIIHRNKNSFICYLSDFVKLLGETNIDFKIEVQAALRGLSQIYLTTTAISSRHNFGQIFQKQFGWKVLFYQLLSIGPVKIIQASLPLLFDAVKHLPEQEVGPTLDERDLTAIGNAIKLLNDENVCNIEMNRSSPEENVNLKLATDRSSLVKSSHLSIEILTESRPASVKYIVEIPLKDWLKERQEFVRLQGIGQTMCLVECLEQLRRHSLENYWYAVEGWNRPPQKRSIKEAILINEVKLAAKSLFARRYHNIWSSQFMPISRKNRILWKLLIHLEEKFERREYGHLFIFSKSRANESMGEYSFGTFQRIRIIFYRLIIAGLKGLIRKNRYEMNLLPLTTDELIHRLMHGLLRKGLFTHSDPLL